MYSILYPKKCPKEEIRVRLEDWTGDYPQRSFRGQIETKCEGLLELWGTHVGYSYPPPTSKLVVTLDKGRTRIERLEGQAHGTGSLNRSRGYRIVLSNPSGIQVIGIELQRPQ